MKRKIFILTTIMLSLSLILTGTAYSYNEEISQEEKISEEIVTPIEMSDEEINKYIIEDIGKEKRALPPGYTIKIKYDLHNPKGIDKKLLPKDYVKNLKKGDVVTDYREWEVIKTKEEGVKSSNKVVPLGDDCPVSYIGTRDSTVSSSYSGITQYNRVYAKKYKNYYTYWRIDKTWGKWSRSSSSYTVKDCKLKIYLDGEDCAGNNSYCNKGSTIFTPTWYGNNTNWWYIAGCTDKKIRTPWPDGYRQTWTRCDIYKNGDKIKDDFKTAQYLPWY